MDIIINGADFSAKKIDNVAGSTTFESDKILSIYSRSFTDYQRSLFSAFYHRIKSAGILSKIQKLYMPILAGTLDEAFINIADPALISEISPDATYWTLSPTGIYNNNNSNIQGPSLVTTLNTAIPNNDIHFFHFADEYPASDTDAMPRLSHDTVSTTLDIRYTITSTNMFPNNSSIFIGGQELLPDDAGFNDILLLGLSSTLKGININDNDNLNAINGEIYMSHALGNPLTGASVTGNIDFAGQPAIYMMTPHGLLSLGNSFTQNEAQLYARYAQLFFDNFNA